MLLMASKLLKFILTKYYYYRKGIFKFKRSKLEICGILKHTTLENGERKVFKGMYGKTHVIIKEPEYRPSKEFLNTCIATELLQDKVPKPLFFNDKDKVPKPLYFNDKIDRMLVLEYFDYRSRDWPAVVNGKNGNELNEQEYKKLVECLSLLHSSKLSPLKEKILDVEKYGGKPLHCKAQEDLIEIENAAFGEGEKKDLKAKLNDIVQNLPQKSDEIVISHGDFKPDNILTIRDNNITKDIKIIDWIDLGFRCRQYDVGSLLFGLDKEKVLELVKYYLESSRLDDKNPVLFSKEAIAIACVVHISEPLRTKDKEKTSRYINYAYDTIQQLKQQDSQ